MILNLTNVNYCTLCIKITILLKQARSSATVTKDDRTGGNRANFHIGFIKKCLNFLKFDCIFTMWFIFREILASWLIFIPLKNRRNREVSLFKHGTARKTNRFHEQTTFFFLMIYIACSGLGSKQQSLLKSSRMSLQPSWSGHQKNRRKIQLGIFGKESER